MGAEWKIITRHRNNQLQLWLGDRRTNERKETGDIAQVRLLFSYVTLAYYSFENIF